MKLISWNVNGIRAILKKGFIEWLTTESPDILCLQETKADLNAVPAELKNIPGFFDFWSAGTRKGYSGTVVYTKVKPSSVSYGFDTKKNFDFEGRIIICEFQDFELLNIYFPNGQKDDARLQYKLDFYDATLEFCENRKKSGKELVICGDYNTAHNEIDLARPKENQDVSGFLRIERDWMDKWESFGYKDSFRELHPREAGAYTWWSLRTAARSRNIGWRLDYFYVTKNLMHNVKKSEIMANVTGSDHCPIILELTS
jgi:exodeoxyribonuclease-3